MPCYRPNTAYRTRKHRDSKTGKWPVTFKLREGFHDLSLSLPCGQCIGCRQEYSRMWAIRCFHEASLYKYTNQLGVSKSKNSFLTLTYNDKHLPEGGTLIKQAMVKFMKDLRFKFVKKNPYDKKSERSDYKQWELKNGIRFFLCGEYGEKLSRPHYHVLLFNHVFHDQYEWKYDPKTKTTLTRSPDLEQLWPYGHSLIGEVTFDSAAYVARYITKKYTGENSYEHYQLEDSSGIKYDLLPEFTNMSRNPGIGSPWFDVFGTDVYPRDEVVIRNGIICRPPRYYDNKLDKQNPTLFKTIQAKRKAQAIAHQQNTDPDRLRVQEAIKNKQFNLLVRPIERRTTK